MDIALIIISLIFGCIGFIVGIGSTDLGEKKVALWMILFSICTLVWTTSAMSNFKPNTTTVVEKPIETLRSVPFYFDENEKPVQIVGDGRFADPKTTIVRITNIEGGWSRGVYITNTRKVEFATKEKVEK